MTPHQIIQELRNNKTVFQELLSHVSDEMIQWKPGKNEWSLLEIVCHLHDEECEDFRARTRCALETPHLNPQPIDPVGWVHERAYSEQDYQTTLDKFLSERDTSIKWLSTLENCDWSSALQHYRQGKMSAMTFLCNWLAHDYHHIRQINRLKYEYLRCKSEEDLTYAGKWR